MALRAYMLVGVVEQTKLTSPQYTALFLFSEFAIRFISVA